MSENGEGKESRAKVISLSDDHPPMPQDEAVAKMKGVIESLADSSQRLGLDPDAVTELREQLKHKLKE